MLFPRSVRQFTATWYEPSGHIPEPLRAVGIIQLSSDFNTASGVNETPSFLHVVFLVLTTHYG